MSIRLSHVALLALGVVSWGSTASATPIYINDPGVVRATPLTSVTAGTARFRVANTSWDVALGPSVGTVNGAALAHVGDTAAIVGRDWHVRLANDPTLGLSFAYKTGAGNWNIVDWGLTPYLGFDSLDRAYNTLRVAVRATGAGRSASLSNLTFQFIGGGVYNNVSGLTNLLVTPSTPASTYSNFPSDAAGNESHWITSGPLPDGTDLRAKAWRLNGVLRLDAPGGNPNENLRLNISLLEYRWGQLPADPAIPQVPEPETYLMMAMGLGLGAFWKRRSAMQKRKK